MNFATIVKEIRGQRTQTEFGKLTGMSNAAVSRYESGQRMPQYDAISALLRVAEPAQQRALLEALGVTDMEEFAEAILASAGVTLVAIPTPADGCGKEEQ